MNQNMGKIRKRGKRRKEWKTPHDSKRKCVVLCFRLC